MTDWYNELTQTKPSTDWYGEMTGASPKTAPAIPPDNQNTFRNVTDAALRGATLGFSDEVGAAGAATGDALANILRGKSPNWRNAYDDALKDIRQRQDEFGKGSPQAAFWAETVGSLGGLGGAATKAVAGAKSLPKMFARSAGAGAGTAAVAGAGNATGDLSDRAVEAATAAPVGAAAGLAIPGVGIALGKAVEVAARVLPASAKREAAMKVAEALSRDEITKEQAMTRLGQIGDTAFLADVGENMRRLGGAASRVPGAGRTKAVAALERRQRRQHERILSMTRDALGVEGKYSQQAADLISARKTAADPAYQKAYDEGWGQGKAYSLGDMKPLIDLPQVKGLWANARRMAQADKASGAIPPEYQFPKLEMGEMPDVRALDYIKQALDGKVNVLFKNGRGAEATSLKNVRNKLRDIADDLSPSYKEARSLFESPSHSLELMEQGRAFAKGDTFLTAQEITKLSPAEKTFFREGVGQKIADILRGKKEDADKVALLLRTPEMREKLRATFESPAKYMGWLRSMMGEEKMNKTLRELAGSPTAERIEVAADFSQPGLFRDIVWAMGGNPFAKQRLFGRAQNAVAGRPREAVAAELANLFSDNPNMQAEVLNAATKIGPVGGARKAIPFAAGQAGAAQSYKPEAKATAIFPAYLIDQMVD